MSSSRPTRRSCFALTTSICALRTGVSLCADLEPVAASMTSKTSRAPAEAPLPRIAGPRGICHGMLVAASKRGPSVITNDAGLERIAAGTGGSASPDCDSRDRHCSSSSQATMSSAPRPATGSPGGAALSRSAASSVLPLLNLSSAQASSELSCFARERRSGVGARPRLLRERRVRLSEVDGRAGDRSSFNAVTRCLDGGASLCAKLTLQSVLSTQPTIVRGAVGECHEHRNGRLCGQALGLRASSLAVLGAAGDGTAWREDVSLPVFGGSRASRRMSLRLRANRCGRGLAAVRVLPSVSPQIWARLVDARASHDEQRVARTGTVSLLLSDSRPNNLPDLLTSFVGRRRELDELQRALGANRLITLTGAGGCGKTRLALRAASQMVDRFPGGIWWVELASLEDEELVGAAIAEALSVRPLPGVTPPQARTPVPAPATRKPASTVVYSGPDSDPGHEQQGGPRHCEPRSAAAAPARGRSALRRRR